jgi:hypothetical protein
VKRLDTRLFFCYTGAFIVAAVYRARSYLYSCTCISRSLDKQTLAVTQTVFVDLQRRHPTKKPWSRLFHPGRLYGRRSIWPHASVTEAIHASTSAEMKLKLLEICAGFADIDTRDLHQGRIAHKHPEQFAVARAKSQRGVPLIAKYPASPASKGENRDVVRAHSPKPRIALMHCDLSREECQGSNHGNLEPAFPALVQGRLTRGRLDCI